MKHEPGQPIKHYEAPWSTLLIVMSVFTTVICLGVSAGASWEAASHDHPALLGWVALLPLVILRLPACRFPLAAPS